MIDKIDGFLKRSSRYGFTSKVLTIEPILNSAVEDLSCKMQLTNHCLHPLLPPDKTGRSGLAVACLTAVREVLGSNRAVGSLSHNHCDLQPWARAVCTFPAVPRSTQPSTLRGTVNEYQLSG